MGTLAPVDLVGRRAAVVADEGLGGARLCAALSDATDTGIVELFERAAIDTGRRRRKGAVALLAVGGYGRQELAPFSDVDVVLVHERRASGVEELASALWYPLWDAGLKLGHAVRSVDDQLALADDDLDTATAMLGVRRLAGDDELADRVATESRARWRKHGRRWLEALRVRGVERRAQAGDVAYLLEPDLKEGHGGLRDVQSLRWAAQADLVVAPADLARLDECYERLLAVRVALHRSAGRAGDVLRLEQQDAVAAVLGEGLDADGLMLWVSDAARSIVWIADGAWRDLGRHQVAAERVAAPGVVESDRSIELADGADVRTDPVLVWRVARVAAECERPIGRATLKRLADGVDPADWAERWPEEARTELVRLLAQGHRALDPLEALDQRGVLVAVLPEWAQVRSRPQRNAYHRYTVDRHLWETAANAAALAERVERPDLLLLGALLHDIGKGYPGDHTDAGVALVAELGPRLGLDPDDVATVRAMVEHHLLLPDTAVRRDLADPATVRRVREAVGDLGTLRLLHALTEADSKATGPSAWGSWKEQLVAELVERTATELGAAPADADVLARASFPDAVTWTAMAGGRVDVAVDEPGDDGTVTVTVVAPDAPGTFARVTGALSLRDLDVLTAWADSADVGAGPMAASRFRVQPSRARVDWAAVTTDLGRALTGQLALEARLAERATTYRRRKPVQAAPAASPAVAFHDGDSDDNTVIEVRAANRIGMLHRIARSLTETGLDIRHATVQSMGEDVVDTFYVRTLAGALVTDAFHRREIERAVLHAVSIPVPH